MRKSSALVFVFALVMSMMAFPASAADVNEKSWQDVDCPTDEFAVYHFVLNRFGDDTNQTLTVDFENSGTVVATLASDERNKQTGGTQHFYVEGGVIDSASTSGDGWLVLSDWDCTGKKLPPS